MMYVQNNRTPTRWSKLPYYAIYSLQESGIDEIAQSLISGVFLDYLWCINVRWKTINSPPRPLSSKQ